jgi:hypothetical protein
MPPVLQRYLGNLSIGVKFLKRIDGAAAQQLLKLSQPMADILHINALLS